MPNKGSPGDEEASLNGIQEHMFPSGFPHQEAGSSAPGFTESDHQLREEL